LADYQQEEGFLAFLRLVGSAYFKKHMSAFKATTPESLYKSTEAMSVTDQHRKWLNEIQKRVWERTVSESHYIPSYDALQLHWRR
jgi:hypothetical protein